MQEWTNKITVECTETVPGSWNEKIETCKALRAYACEKGRKVTDVTPGEVAKTDLGIEGYAKLYETTPEAQPRPGGDGTTGARNPKRKADQALGTSGNPPTDPGEKNDKLDTANKQDSATKDKDENTVKRTKKDQTGARKEKEAKELLAQEQASDNSMTKTTMEMAKDPAWWTWAKEAVGTYQGCRKEVITLYANNPFFQAMKVAALSPKEMAALKKAYKDDYIAKLVEFVSTLGPKIQAMAQASYQIQLMATAKRGATEPVPQKAAGKAKAKKKAAIKKSPSSVQSA